MAAIQPFVNLQPFKGTDSENIEEFFRNRASCLQVANIQDDNRHQYLHLRMKGGALTFFDQLSENTRNDFDHAVEGLRNRHKNDQRESNY